MSVVACTACLLPTAEPPRETFREPIFGRELGIYLCGGCGVGFSPVPADFPLREWYAKAGHLYGEAEWIIHPPPRRDWRFNFFFRQARRRGLEGELLDLGSGDGRFLERAAELGWRGSLRGVEGNPDMARRRRGRFEIEVTPLEAYLARAGAPARDVVTLFDVLEHLAEPGRALSRIAGLLKPGGRLVITVPNEQRLRLFEREAWDYPPNHNTRWTADALRALARRNGLEVELLAVSPPSPRGLSDQLFYRLFQRAMPLAKRLVFGAKADGGKTFTELSAARGDAGLLADKSRRRRVELALSWGFAAVAAPLSLPAALALSTLAPRRKGACLFLMARRPA